jgi:hypothetical protein
MRGAGSGGIAARRTAFRQSVEANARAAGRNLLSWAFDRGRRRRWPASRFGCAGECHHPAQAEQPLEHAPAARTARERLCQRIEPPIVHFEPPCAHRERLRCNTSPETGRETKKCRLKTEMSTCM